MNLYEITYSHYGNDIHKQHIVAESISKCLEIFGIQYENIIVRIEVLSKSVNVQQKN
jgi:hypothetical protein